jgi:putative restriction endonuclease
LCAPLQSWLVTAEIDGPMLERGLAGRHGQRLTALPKIRTKRPETDLLEERYARFRLAD